MKLANKKAFVLDLDGTVYVGNAPIQSAIDFINSQAKKYEFFYMTNNTSKAKTSYVSKLKDMGIRSISEKNVLTPVASLTRHLIEQKMTDVYCVGTEALKEELRKANLHVIEDVAGGKVAAVVLGYDTEITYKKIREAGLLLGQEAVGYFATHMDRVCPSEEGPIPDVGSFIELFKCSNGRIPDRIFGKPNREMLLPVLERFHERELVVVGDRLYTDMALARKANIDFILVLSGETARTDVEEGARYPGLILNELGDLGERIRR